MKNKEHDEVETVINLIEDEFERLRNGRDLNPTDTELLYGFVGMALKAREAREAILREGTIIDDGKGFPVPHPAIEIEKTAVIQLQNFVKARPDLFGEQKKQRKSSGGFSNLKAV